MRCKNCNKEIQEYEIFCEECKKELKNASSKKQVNELEHLIQEQKKLNEMEDTKELVNLNTLVEEELKIEKSDEETKDNNKVIEKTTEEIKEIKQESDNKEIKDVKKKNKKVLIIIISLICVLIISLIIVFLVFNKKDNKEEKEEVVIDYEKVIDEYGESVQSAIENYIQDKNEVPTWQQVSELTVYDNYDVVCEIHNIYSDGSIYLNTCKVNDKSVEYSYGEEKEEIKEGKKVNVYKINYGNDYYSYTSTNESGSSLVGTITCKTEECTFISAYNKYVVIKEENQYYLYNYETDTMEFGPFSINDEYMIAENVLANSYTLYGVFYNENGKNNIYNVKTGKTLKNISGTPVVSEFYYDPSILYKYNLVPMNNNGKTDFINLKTGNVSFSIKENLGSYVEDSTNKIVYITAYTDNSSKFKIYNSNGKLLFDGKEFSKFEVGSNTLLVATETNFKAYDNNLKLKTSSKDYDQILGLYEDFVVVTKDSDLKILSVEDVELATFEDGWSDNYTFHSMLSGWYTENGKNGIYLVIENNDIPYGTMGSGMEYYYIPNTQETGIIETEGVGGYAKPVLYLYPEEKTEVTVTFSNPNVLTTTYPKFKNNWSVTAYPNGDLYDKNDNYYYALYWEEEKNHYIDFSEGFYVTKDNAIEFLEEKLSIIGLNAKERNEFIMYWLPILEKNEKSLVYFELTSERDQYNKLIINPKPDSLLRVAIHVKKVNKKTSIKEQKLTTFNRTGFTAVEWGGVIY